MVSAFMFEPYRIQKSQPFDYAVRMMDSVTDMLNRLSAAGLNHWGVVSPQEYDATARAGIRTDDLFPEATSILVLASGGRALWDAFVADLTKHPKHLSEEQHPLDAYVKRCIDDASSVLGDTPHRWFFASAEADVHLDFRTLAVRAGLGAPSRLGLVIDGVYGPWMGLRAACMLSVSLPVSEPAADHCGPCPAPCVSACPGSALEGGRWSVDVCASFHRTSTDCDTRCDARSACPLGHEHRYSEVQARYHYNRAVGRDELSQALKIEDKKYSGIGPLWADWSE